jgi:hypothetical protein
MSQEMLGIPEGRGLKADGWDILLPHNRRSPGALSEVG